MSIRPCKRTNERLRQDQGGRVGTSYSINNMNYPASNEHRRTLSVCYGPASLVASFSSTAEFVPTVVVAKYHINSPFSILLHTRCRVFETDSPPAAIQPPAWQPVCLVGAVIASLEKICNYRSGCLVKQKLTLKL